MISDKNKQIAEQIVQHAESIRVSRLLGENERTYWVNAIAEILQKGNKGNNTVAQS